MKSRGVLFDVGRWRVFLAWQGAIASPKIWGYRYNPNGGYPVRSLLIFWTELSWFAKP